MIKKMLYLCVALVIFSNTASAIIRPLLHDVGVLSSKFLSCSHYIAPQRYLFSTSAKQSACSCINRAETVCSVVFLGVLAVSTETISDSYLKSRIDSSKNEDTSFLTYMDENLVFDPQSLDHSIFLAIGTHPSDGGSSIFQFIYSKACDFVNSGKGDGTYTGMD